MVWWKDMHYILHVLNESSPSQLVQVIIWQNNITLLHCHIQLLHVQPPHNPQKDILFTK